MTRPKYGSCPYEVTKHELERFVKDPLVHGWLQKYAPPPSRVRYDNSHRLARFFKWLRVIKAKEASELKNITPKKLLNMQLKASASHDIEERSKVKNWLLDFARDNPDFATHSGYTKYAYFSVARSFFQYYEVPLSIARGSFGRVKLKKHKEKPLSISKVKRILGKLRQRERAILLIMAQSGMGAGEVLDKLNYMWPQIASQLHRERIKVELDGRKGNQKPYFTFISKDAIHELKKWLIQREKITGHPMHIGEPIFIKTMQARGEPYTSHDFFLYLNKRLKTLGLKTKPWELRSHLFRKVFKTEAGVPDRAIDKDFVEFMMGHGSSQSISQVGGIYDKTPEIHEEIIENEYAKLEPFLNIYSHPEIAQTRSPKEEAFYDELGGLLREHPEKWEKFKKFIKEL